MSLSLIRTGRHIRPAGTGLATRCASSEVVTTSYEATPTSTTAASSGVAWTATVRASAAASPIETVMSWPPVWWSSVRGSGHVGVRAQACETLSPPLPLTRQTSNKAEFGDRMPNIASA